MKLNFLKSTAIILCSAALFTTACRRDKVNQPAEVTVAGPNINIFGITRSNELVAFNASTPGTSSKNAITGLVAGETLMSIDYRPSTGELYALSSASKLYIINTTTFAAHVVNATPFTPAISGTVFSIDFNPTVDRLRLVSNNGQNLRLNPETGIVAATDMAINGGASPAISGIAYTNSRAGAATTMFLALDQVTAKLYEVNPPNNGTLVEKGNLGIAFTGQIAFDISPDNSAALVAAKVNSVNTLYLLDIASGKATKIANTREELIDIAIPTEPVAYSVDAANNLLIYNPETTSPSVTSKPITGLQAAETIQGIDFRPLNGQLYALGSTSRLYTINAASGAAAQVGTAIFSTLLNGTDFGFDFNPTVDRIRVVSNLGQSMVLNPTDGTVASVSPGINPGLPMVTSAAYSNNFAGATTTVFYVLDHNADRLYTQSPATSTITDIGPLGVNIDAANGFDIGSTTGKAYLATTVGGVNRIYSVNLSNGATTSMGMLTTAVKGFTIGTGF